MVLAFILMLFYFIITNKQYSRNISFLYPINNERKNPILNSFPKIHKHHVNPIASLDPLICRRCCFNGTNSKCFCSHTRTSHLAKHRRVSGWGRWCLYQPASSSFRGILAPLSYLLLCFWCWTHVSPLPLSSLLKIPDSSLSLSPIDYLGRWL